MLINGSVSSHDSALMSRTHQSGMSGSPVLSNSSIIGVHYGDNSTTAYFVPAPIILQFLSQLGGDPPSPLPHPGDGDGSSVAPISPPVNQPILPAHSHDHLSATQKQEILELLQSETAQSYIADLISGIDTTDLEDQITRRLRKEFLNAAPETLLSVIQSQIAEQLSQLPSPSAGPPGPAGPPGSPGPAGPPGSITVTLYQDGRPTQTATAPSGSTVKLPVSTTVKRNP